MMYVVLPASHSCPLTENVDADEIVVQYVRKGVYCVFICSICVHLWFYFVQAQSQVTKLQTRLETNLLKRLGQLQAAAAQPELAGQRAGLESLQQDLARAESALADVEGRLAAVEARSDELSKEVRLLLVPSSI
jgi:septal ring factor EnvC (AmiA/AmiB activator)